MDCNLPGSSVHGIFQVPVYKIFHINGAHKKAGVAILISDKIDLKKKKRTSQTNCQRASHFGIVF